MERYDPLKIEAKWQKKWEETEAFKATEEPNVPKMMVAEMFPYPSGAGLHVGHVRNFTIVDVLTRFYEQQRLNVMRPFGYDTFGLPAENYAIKTGRSSKEVTTENVANFRKNADGVKILCCGWVLWNVPLCNEKNVHIMNRCRSRKCFKRWRSLWKAG